MTAGRLGEILFENAARRGLDPGEGGEADAFRLIRDLPYGRPTGTAIDAPILEWRGTCSGKHMLLGAVLDEFGLRSRMMIATYRFSWTLPGPVPTPLVPILESGPVPDVHNFLSVTWDGARFHAVDATWPKGGRTLGLVVNDWSPGRDHVVACTKPYEAWALPPGHDLREEKQRILARHCGADLARREAFIEALAAWLETAPYPPASRDEA